MGGQDTMAVVGAGIIGAAVAYALALEGRKVLLLDRADPGVAGASFGNVGHIAAELVQPLPSPGLLFGFWRELFRFGGALDLPPSRALGMLPWIGRFAAAAFRQDEGTRHLAPLVKPAAAAWAAWLGQIGQPELMRRHGHYEVQLGAGGTEFVRKQTAAMQALGIETRPMREEELSELMRAAGQSSAAGLWFEKSAHVLDPLAAVQTLAAAAAAHGAQVCRFDAHALVPRGDRIEIHGDAAPLDVGGVVVCAGVESAPLLAPFGVRAPLEGVRGYHVELQGRRPFLDAPVVYNGEHVLVTPMRGRLRASSYMEFARPGAPPDPRKPARLRAHVAALGYPIEADGPSWMGSRPVLPDYLPGIGRVNGSSVYYALGHQHIGLTIAPITGLLVADLVAGRVPRLAVAAFDLERFN
ncbi:MAG TPA: FAD-binding oxidoreductase [Steroidobacteraceae bacterium]|nr:FAD-binding oxidoreductase [Steroidobacteraceae bacterium]